MRWLALVIACAACGDNLPRDDVFTAVSGSRLTLQTYRYEDGTEQTVANEFYDLQLHARCAARPWTDGAVRCVPVADDVEFFDPACTMLVGIDRTGGKPSFFVASAGTAPIHVYRAGASLQVITQYYAITNGVCAATPAPFGTVAYVLGDELDGTTQAELHDREVGEGRIALVVRESDDGVRVQAGLRDRMLGVGCAARARSDGSVVCEPLGAAAAAYFHDPGCSEPVVAVAAATPPAFASVIEPTGCASYHGIGADLAPPIYRRDASGCTAVDPPSNLRLRAVEAAVELPTVSRTLENARGRRLQHIVLDADLGSGLRVVDDRLHDTTNATDCTPRALRDGTRCIPVNLAAVGTFYTAGCTTQLRVAELPQRPCEPIGFAGTTRPFQIRSVGDPVSTVFVLDGTDCAPYSGLPGNVLRVLGPPIDVTQFPAAIYYGER
jgi:hypothetical protein